MKRYCAGALVLSVLAACGHEPVAAMGQETAVAKDFDSAFAGLQAFSGEQTPSQLSEGEKQQWQERHINEQRRRALELYEAYPQHPKRWEVVLRFYISGMNINYLGDPQYRQRARGLVRQALAEPGIADELWQAAKRIQIYDARNLLQQSSECCMKVDAGQVHALVDDFVTRYPDSGSVPVLEWEFVTWLGKLDQSQAGQWIRKLAKSPNPIVEKLYRGQLHVLETREKPLELKFTAIDGREVDVAQLRGKVVLLDFWATDCGPCIRELPGLLEIYRKYRAAGFEIVGISVDRPPNRAGLLAFLKEWKIPWPNHFDPDHRWSALADQFGVIGVPTQLLLDKSGRLASDDVRGAKLEPAVRKLLE